MAVEKNHKNFIDSRMLDTILRETISEIEKGKEQIFGVAESARKECSSIEKELVHIQEETKKIVDQVDEWEEKEVQARNKLAAVSKNFKSYSEEDIKEAYEEAYSLKVKVQLLRKEEQQCREKRTELERRYINMKSTVEKAEKLVSQVGAALSYLSSNLQNICDKVDRIQQRQNWGLAVIKGQEEERRRIARGIHDGPAQSLANIVLRVEFCQKALESSPDLLKNELDDLKMYARSTLEDIRKILFDLRPMDLDDLGIIAALKRFLESFEKNTGIKVDFCVKGSEKRYIPGLEVALFRVVQEALNNVKKHSNSDTVYVLLELSPLSLNTVVEDYGVGFNTEEELKENQFGLKGMKEWTEILGGKLEISSKKNQGTRVEVSIPTEEE